MSMITQPPIGSNDTIVDLGPNRHHQLLTIYQTQTHPKKSGPGCIFYFLQDTLRLGLR